MANERWSYDDEWGRRRYGYDDDSNQYSEYWRDRGPRYGRPSSYQRGDRGFEYSSLPVVGSNYGGGWREERDRDWRRYGSRDRDDWTRDPYSAERYYGRDRGYLGRDDDWRQRDEWSRRNQWQDRGDDWRRESRGGERPFWERAKDEVRSWMGDEEAEQRRRADHRGRGPKGYTRSDERIREDVNDRLMEDWGVDATDIEVSVVAGEVTLTGTVDGRESKRRAEDIAADVLGVRDVQNSLRVRRPSPTSASATEVGTGTTTGTSTTGLGTTTTGTTTTTTPRH
jgi:osmotically-inducible protein OsmY